jgi:hypothetical protein
LVEATFAAPVFDLVAADKGVATLNVTAPASAKATALFQLIRKLRMFIICRYSAS